LLAPLLASRRLLALPPLVPPLVVVIANHLSFIQALRAPVPRGAGARRGSFAFGHTFLVSLDCNWPLAAP
jgi:hypothetical protein